MGSDAMREDNRKKLTHLIQLAKQYEITTYDSFLKKLQTTPKLKSELNQLRENVVVGFSLYLYFEKLVEKGETR